MKVKLDDYDVRILINGLHQQWEHSEGEGRAQIGELILRLAALSDRIKPNRRKKIPFTPEESRLICRCLVDWRNRELENEKYTAAEVIGELLILFTD